MQRSAVLLSLIIAAFALPIGISAQSKSVSEGKAITIIFNDGHRQTIPMDELSRIEFKSGPIMFFKDGHQQALATDEVARIEFNASEKNSPLGRNYFVGKWEVGTGNMGGKFFITLDPDGHAHKTIGASHGTWTVVDGEARISWDDGWHDAIRKVGSKHEKFAYEPGKSFSDSPSNVTDATNLTAQPI